MRYAKFYTDTYKITNTPCCVQKLSTPSFHSQITLLLPDSPIDMNSISQILRHIQLTSSLNLIQPSPKQRFIYILSLLPWDITLISSRAKYCLQAWHVNSYRLRPLCVCFSFYSQSNAVPVTKNLATIKIPQSTQMVPSVTQHMTASSCEISGWWKMCFCVYPVCEALHLCIPEGADING